MSFQSLPSASDRAVGIQATMPAAMITHRTHVHGRRRHSGRAMRFAVVQAEHHEGAFPRHHNQAANIPPKTRHRPRQLLSLGRLYAVGNKNGSNKLDKQPPTSKNSNSSDDDIDDNTSGGHAKLIATLSVAGGIAILIAGGVLLKDQIKAFLDLFIQLVDDWGPLGYLAYIGVYASLELLAVPAIPLTMTAGVIFGVGAGTAVVSVAATMAATGAFLIARYIARDKVASLAAKNPKWQAIDRAIGKDGFRVVALLRLSPLLPLAASNYLYGLTSVDLGSYVLASWVGMLPGTLAYVAAGTYGRELMLGLTEGANGGGGVVQPWQIALGVGVSGLAVWYVGRVATKALAELEEEEVDDR